MILSSALRRGIRSTISSSRSTSLLAARNAFTAATSSKGPGVPPNVLRSWYNIFGKSTAGYITWIVAGVLATEFVTGFGIDSLWASVNSGRTYDSVDWTKFKVEDDDDDEDDEEDEEEEGEGEGEGDDEDEDDEDDE
eukprot:CAMPEP_0203638328 /NCGR_PEP_ID=MMETSP0088-20131115/4384_1 /ASSEMBLY_ACC=CAM_ASM_001087 /TAXON_ID=426623 /ORGANISM="Chaetoceros affinis, Strain CCMP159" /LENGTH=136 /DNA_ID=CAMNT_0050492937 /DNA_START=54 /DNA_END=464 /DNA_ORIENTATION=-